MSALFDTAATARALEAAYRTMATQFRAGRRAPFRVGYDGSAHPADGTAPPPDHLATPEEASNPCPPKRRPARRPRFPATASVATRNSPTSCSSCVRDHPRLAAIESIGKSHEGRDIWLLTVTNTATGPAADKPAFWVDGNIHATEVAASTANLHFLDLAAARIRPRRRDHACARHAGVLRLSANQSRRRRMGARRPAEVGALVARGRTRSTRRRSRASTVEDIDGDGRILQMRIADANGLWKEHPEAPRPHDPPRTDRDRRHATTACCPKGTVEGWDGFTLRVKRNREGLDLNRNFPASWRQEFEQLGAGPVSDVGAGGARGRRLHRPALQHLGGTTFHTWSGVLLRPFEHLADEEMHAEDLWHYRRAGDKGDELTGYPAISVYHEFRYHPKQVIGGTFDWIYEHLGHLRVGGRDLEPDARGGHRRLQVHRLVSRPPARPTTSSSAAGARRRSAGSRHVRWRPYRPPAARRRRARRLEPLPRIFESAAAVPGARGRALPALAPLAGADLAAARARRRPRPRRSRRRQLARAPRRPEHRAGCRATCPSARWSARSCAARSPRSGCPRARRWSRASGARTSASSKAGRTSTPACRSGPTAHVTDDRVKVEWVLRAAPGTEVALTLRHERAGVVRARVVLR